MIQIDMLMPEGCSECRFETKRGFCKAMPDNFCGCTNDERRPEWCPLEEQPEIVRCRDCKNGEQGACGYGVDCDGVWHADDWFCADGERRETND